MAEAKGHVLVTGGAGYIGSHTCKALAAAGYGPVVLDSMVHGHPWAVQWGPLVEGDVRDAQLLDSVFALFRPVAVLHFAALTSVGESVADPGPYYDNNLGGALALLEAMRRAGCPAVVFSSTAAVYGDPAVPGAPMDENHPLAPVNPYGRAKLAVERMLADYGAAYGLRHMSLRYFNAAGADPEGELGEEHDPETHLVPLAIGAALGTRGPLRVFGQDYPTPDGTCVRDYVHVADLARAHVLALGHLARGGPSGALNLGTGRGNSVREVLAAVERASGRPVPCEPAPRRAGDPGALVAAAGRARAVLGWSPDLTDLDSIVSTAWRWHAARA
jgi:UDP-glucose-4-epimerase GalE